MFEEPKITTLAFRQRLRCARCRCRCRRTVVTVRPPRHFGSDRSNDRIFRSSASRVYRAAVFHLRLQSPLAQSHAPPETQRHARSFQSPIASSRMPPPDESMRSFDRLDRHLASRRFIASAASGEIPNCVRGRSVTGTPVQPSKASCCSTEWVSAVPKVTKATAPGDYVVERIDTS